MIEGRAGADLYPRKYEYIARGGPGRMYESRAAIPANNSNEPRCNGRARALIKIIRIHTAVLLHASVNCLAPAEPAIQQPLARGYYASLLQRPYSLSSIPTRLEQTPTKYMAVCTRFQAAAVTPFNEAPSRYAAPG